MLTPNQGVLVVRAYRTKLWQTHLDNSGMSPIYKALVVKGFRRK